MGKGILVVFHLGGGKRRSHGVAAVLVALALLAVAPAYAQQTTGNIVGRITDEQKAAVPGSPSPRPMLRPG